ncbi:16S rRNA (guanine527-N7)-methyltransferase [Allocatelliglobosispora scoriae]|uniref:Ribosomal RNA small subunit methyltransferase G n=1 Tax=Allocatelliglobosispora scoriae TaxID=643052 RepID=A0A841BU99_9ACTN|nr:16S rRNA (guanine(527)-N(7))-methyltransferase RsmG [Allocatelliglobosispora scoriae]MBB5871016.1 16S rRNA (guanine527-N7)-methyltransferase [Allocatelliglobosispora scoriae]
MSESHGPASLDAADGGAFACPPSMVEAATQIFGSRMSLASRYAELLVTDGVVRGLIGPREAPRIWDRHIVNCGVVSSLLTARETIVDVGSGAGLPGIVLAVARPDISVILVEPLARRTSFLVEAVAILELKNVTVQRGRAEEMVGKLPPADVVTARAVAPLDRLAGWCLPLARIGGRMLALKGSSAAEEIIEHQSTVTRLGGGPATLHHCGVGLIDPPTTVVEVECIAPARSKRGGASRRR